MAKPVNHRLPVLRGPFDPPPTYGHCIVGDSPTIDSESNTGTFTERAMGKRRCEASNCPYILDVSRSESRPGRRHNGLAPEWTINAGNMRASGLSCALDAVKLHPNGMSATEIGNAEGLSKRRVEQILKRWRYEAGAVRLIRLSRGDE